MRPQLLLGEHRDFVKAKFEEDVAEGLMEKMTLGEFKARFGENRAIASLAVIVEDEEKDKKRIIHDATHGVRVNHRIRCRDKREKKQILRELVRCQKDISKAHRRYKHQESEHGFGCQIDAEETIRLCGIARSSTSTRWAPSDSHRRVNGGLG